MGQVVFKRPIYTASSCTITETLTASSNVTLTKAATLSSGAIFSNYLDLPLETGTTAANFANHGITQFGSTAAKTYTMTVPARAGVLKVLMCTAGTTGAIQKVRVSTGGATKINGSTANFYASFNAAGDCLLMYTATTVLWRTVVNTGTVTFSTS